CAVTARHACSGTDINGGLLVFTPATNANGSPEASFTFQVQDDGGTALGGVDLDQTANTMTINVTSVTDAPAGTHNAVVITECGAHIFTAAEFGFTDPTDASSGSAAGADDLFAVTITTVPTAASGSLTLDGVAVTAGQSVSVTDINGGLLVFTPATNANGSPEASFTLQVRGDSGNAPGGGAPDQNANTMTINVTPVNDAPPGTDNAVLITEGGAHIFT